MADSTSIPNLPDVTVCAADSLTPGLAARALDLSVSRARFGDAILFSDQRVEGGFRHVAIEPIRSMADYSAFCLRGMLPHIRTKFVLVVQWDGYVTGPASWNRRFLNYDYVGAPFYDDDGERYVGNGGFSLRSRRLLEAAAKLPVIRGANEDLVMCKMFRSTLERDHGIRFAPLATAERFSHEHFLGRATFGFHGESNFWRYESDDDIIAIYEAKPERARFALNAFGLVVECVRNDRLELARAVLTLIRGQRDDDAVVRDMDKHNVPAELVRETLAAAS